MTLAKVINPVEYSFTQWINNYPDSTHWLDKARFFTFTKTVCRYNGKKWKDSSYLKERILKANPHFDAERLTNVITLYRDLIEFYASIPITSDYKITDIDAGAGNYIEIKVVHGEVLMKEVPFKKKEDVP
jgi:hypothetical protein